MANHCYYDMKIKGFAWDCREWVRRMQNYNAPHHFFSIFSCDVYDEGETDDGDCYMQMFGDCAWSLDTCCRGKGYSGNEDLFSINTKELNLVMEVFSSEPGVGFQEHYLYDKGDCVEDQCEDYEEWFWDRTEYETFEQFKEGCDLPDSVTEDDLDDNSCYTVGGFGEWNFKI